MGKYSESCGPRDHRQERANHEPTQIEGSCDPKN
jgi:hypothetical protein